MKRLLRTMMGGVILALFFGMVAPVIAQPTHSLAIRDGKVWIDNQEVPAERLPSSLRVEDVQISYNWVGHDTPQLTINNVLYALEDGTLRELANLHEEGGGVMVFFRDGSYAPYDNKEAAFAENRAQSANSVAQLQSSARALRAYSDELAELSEAEGTGQNAYVLRQVRDKAQEAAEVAQAMPRLEVQSYLAGVQQQNEALYDLLVQEWQMEAETNALALQIRRMTPGTNQQQLVEELRQKLNIIFELKQENRRREIRQLEAAISDLQSRLKKREAYRTQMVEQRLQELIAAPANR